MNKFCYSDDAGTIMHPLGEFASMDDAIEAAEEFCRDGEWRYDGAEIYVTVTELDDDGDEVEHRHITVAIEPDHDRLISDAGGDTSCHHQWVATHAIEGGLRDNPGVWSCGGTRMIIAHHCRLCGLQRTEHVVGAQSTPGACDKFTYEQPETWCSECECIECTCEDE